MPMPETAVNEYHAPAGTENKVWRPRQAAIMQPVTVAHAVRKPPHTQFRLGVFRTHGAHIGAALPAGESISIGRRPSRVTSHKQHADR
jgi:hypothetical protein